MAKVLGIIPARGGSKSVPGKNLRLLGDRPLIAWTIQAALDSGRIDRLLVSTDDPAIAAAARDYGAETPFLRPSELAADDTPTLPVLLHALDWLEACKEPANWVACLQPTSPFRSAQDVTAAVRLMEEKDADGVVSVTELHQHPMWAKRMDPAGRLTSYLDVANVPTRRQELPPAFAPNGAIYIARTSILRECGTWYTDATYGYVMPAERSLDIDTPWDWHLASLLIKEPFGS